MVTKPGLSVPVGQPAINPVLMKVIKDGLCKVLKETDCPLGLEATISFRAARNWPRRP